MGGEPDFEQFARETGAGQRAIQKLRTHLMGQGRSASYVEDLQAAGENHPDQGIRDRFQKGHWERTEKDTEDKPKVRGASRKQACGNYESFDACVADNQDADDPEAFCGELEKRTKKGSTKRAWMGWNGGRPEQRKVAGWDWDDHLDAYVSSSPRVFTCSCGAPFDTPTGFHRCACGVQHNSYVIGSGGDRKEASAEKYLVREIPTRDNVIVASKTASEVDTELDESIGDEVKAQDDYTHRAEDAEQAGRDDVADRYREVRKDEENHEREFRSLESSFAQYVADAYVARESALTKLTDPGEITETEETGTPTMKPMPADWARRNPDGRWNQGPAKKLSAAAGGTSAKFDAVNPYTGETTTRGSKHNYTHALLVHFPETPEWKIPAGRYTIPPSRRGPGYTTNVSRDQTEKARPESWDFVSFHKGEDIAHKAGRTYLNQCAVTNEENKGTYGDLYHGIPIADKYEVVPVTRRER